MSNGKQCHWCRWAWRRHPVKWLTRRVAVRLAPNQPSRRKYEFSVVPYAIGRRNSSDPELSGWARAPTTVRCAAVYLGWTICATSKCWIESECLALNASMKLTFSSSVNSAVNISAISLMNNKSTLTWNSCVKTLRYLNCFTFEWGMIRCTILHSTKGLSSVQMRLEWANSESCWLDGMLTNWGSHTFRWSNWRQHHREDAVR